MCWYNKSLHPLTNTSLDGRHNGCMAGAALYTNASLDGRHTGSKPCTQRQTVLTSFGKVLAGQVALRKKVGTRRHPLRATRGGAYRHSLYQHFVGNLKVEHLRRNSNLISPH
eukprot:4033589-Pyramimonas_sp.AAC.1